MMDNFCMSQMFDIRKILSYVYISKDFFLPAFLRVPGANVGASGTFWDPLGEIIMFIDHLHRAYTHLCD